MSFPLFSLRSSIPIYVTGFSVHFQSFHLFLFISLFPLFSCNPFPLLSFNPIPVPSFHCPCFPPYQFTTLYIPSFSIFFPIFIYFLYLRIRRFLQHFHFPVIPMLSSVPIHYKPQRFSSSVNVFRFLHTSLYIIILAGHLCLVDASPESPLRRRIHIPGRLFTLILGCHGVSVGSSLVV